MTFSFPPASAVTDFDLVPIEKFTKDLPGYYVISTASINVEDTPLQINTSAKEQIQAIAKYLLNSQNSQIVISIHGYGTKRSEAMDRYQKIYHYVTEICQPQNTVFLGYCWPAEHPTQDEPEPTTGKFIGLPGKLKYALQSLPTLLIATFISTLVLGLITTVLLLGYPAQLPALVVFPLISIFSLLATFGLLKVGDALSLLPTLPIGVLLIGLVIGAMATLSPINLFRVLIFLVISFVFSFSFIFALIALRLSTYLRDTYRGNNYGVLDLVELIRQLDQAVFEIKLFDYLEKQGMMTALLEELKLSQKDWETADSEKKIKLWESLETRPIKKVAIEQVVIEEINKSRLKLTFIGHSLGCLVVTNTIRILSDVFDTDSVRKQPSPDIGRAFRLGRLILVAPDIPIETIMPRRANFLRSSLRRCEEAYVFCSEGDLALRLASTAANYFSFPAKTRISGYKLGNLTVKRFENAKGHRIRRLRDQDYGIVNLKDGKLTRPYSLLEIRASVWEHQSLNEIRPIDSVEKEQMELVENLPVADLFTYFDCTDYTDYTSSSQRKPQGVVSHALRKSALSFWDYFQLSISYFLKQKINAHGGYFDGKFSQKAIYELGFLGFRDFLESFKPGYTINEQLSELSTECQEKYIQLVLSPQLMKILSKSLD